MNPFQRFALSFLALLSLMGAAHAADTKPPARPTFTYRMTDEPESLDWNIAYSSQETMLMMNLMEGLLTVDAQLKVTPGLAESWTISPDGKTYTFKLRPNLVWSDGVALRAQDFIFGWKRLLSRTTGAFYAYVLYDIEGAEAFSKGTLSDFSKVGIKAPDDRTLIVTLNRAIAHWIYIPTLWATFPLRADIVEKHGNAWCTPGRMVTVGPFNLESYEVGRKIVMRSNPRYYGKRSSLDTVVGLVVKDDATAINLFETGRLDFLPELTSQDLKRFEGRPELHSRQEVKTIYLGFVVSRFPSIYPGLRQAIAHSIDHTKVVQILQGGKRPATTFVPPPIVGHKADFGLKYDPELAKSLLKRSGLDLSRPVKLELVHMNWDKPLAVAQFIQAEVKRVLGLQIDLKAYDHTTFHALLDTHEFPMYIGQWGADFPDAENFLSIYAFGERKNRTTWRSPEFDRLILDARGERNPAKRANLYFRAQHKMIEEDAVMVPLYYDSNQMLVQKWVDGLELGATRTLLKNVTIRTH